METSHVYFVQTFNPFMLGLEISLTCVVWTCDTFENNNEIEHKLIKYLKGIC